MKKGIFAALLAVLMMFVAVKPAFAGSINANEDKLLSEFNSVIGEYSSAVGSHADQYKLQARSALNNDAIDLNETAYNEFMQVINTCRGILADNNVITGADGWAVRNQLLSAINDVAKKYNMTVTLKDNGDAVVTISVPADSKSGAPAKTVTVADTKKNVNQTGFGLGQTALVAAAAATVLAGAFFVARKNKLFA